MQTITRKLRSKAGASLLLAMVFLMFCVFVGGSILSAAAANGYRIKHLSDQQQYLDERSAALLITDELTSPEDIDMRVTIIDVSRTIQPISISNGGLVSDTGIPTTEHTILVQLPVGLRLTAMQRLAVEVSIWQYLKNAGATSTDAISLSNFVYNNGNSDIPVTSVSEFWYTYDLSSSAPFTGTVDITGILSNGSAFASHQAHFIAHNGADMYDFEVNFGEGSQMSVCMNASYRVKTPVTSSQITEYASGSTDYARITTKSTQTAIIWSNPKIEKGGN